MPTEAALTASTDGRNAFLLDVAVIAGAAVLYVIGLGLAAPCDDSVTLGVGIASLFLWLLCGLARLTHYRHEQAHSVLPIWWVQLAVGMVAFMPVVRLFDSENFGDGGVCGFRFGDKNSADQQQAFTPDFSSFGHWFQGFLFIMHTPTIYSWWSTGQLPFEWLRWVLCAASCVVIIYPTYNLIKRGEKTGSQFASSSYTSNMFEYLVGASWGVTWGVLAPALVAKVAPAAVGDLSQNAVLVKPYTAIQQVCCFIVALTSLIGAVYTIVTYNN